MRKLPRCRQETRWHILCVKPCFETMPGDRQILLRQWQRFARRDTQLPFHQIDARDRFGHRMLHLQTRVHFHEPEPVRSQTIRAVDNKLNRARAFIANRFRGAHRSYPHRRAHLHGHPRCGGFLNHFLMPPLQRTIPLEEMHRLCAIAKDLHLDMARAGDEFLDQHRVIAKRAKRFSLGAFQPVHKMLGSLD